MIIPEFKNTKEALNFGESIKGNAEALNVLKGARAKAETDFKNLMDKGEFKKALFLASGQGQFLREALEVVEKSSI